MGTTAPDPLRLDLAGDVTLGAIRWRGAPGAPVAVGVHGITGNAWSWAAVARHLAGDVTLVAVDLRGRGTSADAGPPYGIARHADDVAAVIELLSAAPAIVAGHSMGALVALATAERHPGVVAELVLVDGGPPVTVPEGATAVEALTATLGPAFERLREVWPDRVSYHGMWSEHPALAGGLTPEIERYVLSDLVPCDGGFRSAVREEAVRFDGTEMVADPSVRALLDRREAPAVVVRAELGLTGAPPAYIPVEMEERYPLHDWRTIPCTNHHTILIGDAGAAAVAAALRQVAGITTS